MTKNIDIQRFKGALVSGCWPSNPEPLVRDAKGDFVKYSDHEEIISSLLEQIKQKDEVIAAAKKIKPFAYRKEHGVTTIEIVPEHYKELEEALTSLEQDNE